MIGPLMQFLSEITENEAREFARRVAREAADEIGAQPNASGVVPHVAARRAAEMAVLKVYGLEPIHFDNTDVYTHKINDVANGQIGVDPSGLDSGWDDVPATELTTVAAAQGGEA